MVHVHEKKGTRMKTKNFAQRNDSGRLPIAYCLVICFALAGCTYKILNTFDGIEVEALKYGTVSVGAVRVMDYNNVELESAREELTKALKNMRKTLTATPDIAPQTFLLNYDMKNRTFNLSLSGSKEKSGQAGESEQSSQDQSQKEALVDLSKIFKEMIKAQGPRPSETEMIGLRMAALKFIESELEDLKLNKISPADPNYRRVTISLDCSAWVRGDAGAALVYIDLYPYNADNWCHKAEEIIADIYAEERYTEEEVEESLKHIDAGKKYTKEEIIEILKEIKEYTDEKAKGLLKEVKEGKKYTKEEVKKFLKEIKEYKEDEFKGDWGQLIEEEFKDGFESLDELKKNEPEKKSIDKEKGRGDWVALCHSWLRENEFFPRIVNVERMGKAEYLILAESDYRSSEFGIGAAHPIGLTGGLKLQSGEQAQQVTASVRPLSLAFIAGDRRAGWLFMPSKTKEGVMPPTERRLRMVVDIPDRAKGCEDV